MVITNILLGIFVTIVGLLMLITPNNTLIVMLIGMGIVGIINGIMELVRFRKISTDFVFVWISVVKSCLTILLSLLAVFLPVCFLDTAKQIVKILLIVSSIYMFIRAVAEFYLAIRLDPQWRRMQLLKTLICAAIAVFFLVIKAETLGVIIIRIAGAICMLSGIVWAIYNWKNKPIVVVAEEVRDEPEETSDEE